MSLPEWVNPVAFSLALFEETISKPFVAQVMQDIEETMFWRMEYAKREGFRKVREVVNENQMTGYFELVEGISQQRHNEVFVGKINTLVELQKNNIEYRIENPEAKTYSYLLGLVETEEKGVYNYNIDTIFV